VPHLVEVQYYLCWNLALPEHAEPHLAFVEVELSGGQQPHVAQDAQELPAEEEVGVDLADSALCYCFCALGLKAGREGSGFCRSLPDQGQHDCSRQEHQHGLGVVAVGDHPQETAWKVWCLQVGMATGCCSGPQGPMDRPTLAS